MIIKSRFKTTCGTCKKPIKRGTKINWERSTRETDCIPCFHKEKNNNLNMDINIDDIHEENLQTWQENENNQF